MQKILYRGKDIDQKEWRYGSYVAISEPDGYVLHYICELDGQQWIVFPETVSQYIGIEDIHQKKVFRGDIVKVRETIYVDCSREEIEEIREYTGEIVWHQYGWTIASNEGLEIGDEIYNVISHKYLWLWNVKDDETDQDTHFMEIIGNRWDNPEMKVIK